MSEVFVINGLEEIYNQYDTYILDQWGVMHDGKKGYSNAIECVEKLFNKKKNLIIISNSSKRNYLSHSRLTSLGFNKKHFKELMTSGEMIWQSLYNKNYSFTKNLGPNCFRIFDKKNDSETNFIEGLGKYNFVNNIDDADFILGCNPYSNKKIIDYIKIFDLAVTKNLPFMCANPDFETIEIDSFGNNFCMGTLAELYRCMGGEAFILGKPSVKIYLESLKSINSIDKSRVLAIGDSLHHDIKGAINFGIDSLLITSTGIHQRHFDKSKPQWSNLNKSILEIGVKPTFICSNLIF